MHFVAANAGEQRARAVNAPHLGMFETIVAFPKQEPSARGIEVAPW